MLQHKPGPVKHSHCCCVERTCLQTTQSDCDAVNDCYTSRPCFRTGVPPLFARQMSCSLETWRLLRLLLRMSALCW